MGRGGPRVCSNAVKVDGWCLPLPALHSECLLSAPVGSRMLWLRLVSVKMCTQQSLMSHWVPPRPFNFPVTYHQRGAAWNPRWISIGPYLDLLSLLPAAGLVGGSRDAVDHDRHKVHCPYLKPANADECISVRGNIGLTVKRKKRLETKTYRSLTGLPATWPQNYPDPNPTDLICCICCAKPEQGCFEARLEN